MANSKNANIERLRIIACFGIICFHSQTGILKLVGYIGLPIFIMITFCFSTIKKPQSYNESRSALLSNYLLIKANRLIIPYLCWGFVYWCWGYLRMVTSHGEIINVPVTFLFPLYGTSIHLWYLPFVFVGIGVASFIKLYLPLKGLCIFFLYLFLSFITGLVPLFFQDINQLPLPLPQYFFSLPAIFLGLMISNTIDLNKVLKYGLVVIVISLTGMIRLISDNNDSFLFLHLLSFLLVVTAQNIPGEIDQLTAQLSPLTFGIYLIHPIIATIVVNISAITHFQFIGLINPIIIFIISAICIYLLKKTILNKYM
jgi:surface polysaccharide O-acyltransferase-like enzyme